MTEAPQTISGQLTLLEDYLGASLFTRVGRGLELTETGRLVLSYADEIFSLGGELEEVLHQLPATRPRLFRVGVVDVLPKSIAHRILEPALRMPERVRMVCREAGLDGLLAELSVHSLDLVLADRPIPATVSTRGFSDKIGQCAVSFFATRALADGLQAVFPRCLDGAPLLLPGSGTHLRSDIDRWQDKHRLHPRVVAEFDDSALMKAFGQEGAGVFIAVGILVGPAVLGWVSADDQIDLMAKLGIALLLFVVGLKLDPHIIRSMGLGALGMYLGFSKEVGAFLAGVSLASTPYREAIGARLVSLRDKSVTLSLLQGLRSYGYQGWVAVTAHSSGDARDLLQAGADRVLIPYADAAVEAVDKLFGPDISSPNTAKGVTRPAVLGDEISGL